MSENHKLSSEMQFFFYDSDKYHPWSVFYDSAIVSFSECLCSIRTFLVFCLLNLFFNPLSTPQVCTFGSVPLKTYLPDGDIDLTAFTQNQNLKDTWANLVKDILEREEKNENAEFRVKEVQYIQAEVYSLSYPYILLTFYFWSLLLIVNFFPLSKTNYKSI